MLNRNIKSFYINGTIKSDSDIVRLKEMYLKLLTDEMRFKGYVPVLDLDPQFSVKYNHEKDIYSFQLEIYGVYLGTRKAQEIEGFSGQHFIPR
jgi:hypothetical protein